MTYAQLKAFHALALERNFHRAAEKLFLTQPAVSIQIKNLEKECSQTLFRRSGHAVALTENGKALFELTSEMFDAEYRARMLFSASNNALCRTIHLGADGPHVALDLIAAVNKINPEINFRVTLANADTTKENLLSLKVDAAVMANVKVDSRIIGQILTKQNLMALIPDSHELSQREVVTMEELATQPLVFREHGSNTQKIVDGAFSARQLQVNTVLIMGSREGIKEAVVRGLGIGFIFDLEQPYDSRCRGVKIEGLQGSNVDMLLCLKDQQHNSLIKSLFNAAKSLHL